MKSHQVAKMAISDYAVYIVCGVETAHKAYVEPRIHKDKFYSDAEMEDFLLTVAENKSCSKRVENSSLPCCHLQLHVAVHTFVLPKFSNHFIQASLDTIWF